jgi:hypothetical protein
LFRAPQLTSGVDKNTPVLQTVVLGALIRDCGSFVVSGEQLQAEGHMVYASHGEDSFCQVKFALSYAVKFWKNCNLEITAGWF